MAPPRRFSAFPIWAPRAGPTLPPRIPGRDRNAASRQKRPGQDRHHLQPRGRKRQTAGLASITETRRANMSLGIDSRLQRRGGRLLEWQGRAALGRKSRPARRAAAADLRTVDRAGRRQAGRIRARRRLRQRRDHPRPCAPRRAGGRGARHRRLRGSAASRSRTRPGGPAGPLRSRRRHDIRAAAGRDRPRRVPVRRDVLRRSGARLRQPPNRDEGGRAARLRLLASGARQPLADRAPARGRRARPAAAGTGPGRSRPVRLRRRAPGAAVCSATPALSRSRSRRRISTSTSASARGSTRPSTSL